MNEAKLQRLIEGFQDDSLTEAECRELMEWFDEDDSRVAAFADELRTGNALVTLHVLESDSIPSTVKDSVRSGGCAVDISRSVRQRIEDGTQSAVDSQSLSSRHGNRTPWIMAIAAVAAVIALCSILWPRGGSNSSDDVVAMVQNARNSQDVSVGDKLLSGQVLKIASGRVKINFQSGARLAIQAPAELKLVGPNSAQLKHGVVTVRVPGKIKGFVLDTPHQRVTDLGTSFGVEVGTTGDTAISVFEGEIELEDARRLVQGQAVALNAEDETAREIPYQTSQFLVTWQVSFGVEQLIGDVRVADPSERHAPGLVEDSDSLLLFPEREDVLLERGYVVDGTEPGTYNRPFRKNTETLTKDVRVDSFLLQYNPTAADDVSVSQTFQGELHFDRPVVALILQRDLLDSSDSQLALPETNFENIFRRGINKSDVITLSPDRRVLRVAFDVANGVDQIRVLVASDNNLKTQ